jgi:glutamyl-tRNA reductase
MAVLVVGLGHRVPLGLLERMTVAPDRLPKALADLAGREFLSEAVVLSTCHRIEVYAVAKAYHGGVQDIRNFLSESSFAAPEDFSDHLVTYHDDAAVSHLFSVAAGLESVVRGESQILGQVRSAWGRAREEGACGPQLDALFRHALGTGKRARSETAIGQSVGSLSQAAVAMATDRLGSLDGRRIAVVGAGEMGAGVVTGVAADAGDGPEVVVVSRTRERARLVAERSGARAIDLDDLDRALEEVDLLVTSTGSSSVVVTESQMAAVVERRGGRPLLIVDMGMPRDVDGGVGRLDGVTLLDLGDLRAFVDAGLDRRPHELQRVRDIVAEETARFRAAGVQRRAAPTVSALRAMAEEVRRAELERFRSRLAGLDARQQEAVAALTQGILGKLLHQPTVQLKAAAGSPRGERLADAACELFGLPHEEAVPRLAPGWARDRTDDDRTGTTTGTGESGED